MTVHTALDIRPAFEPKSYAEIVSEAAARRKRLFSPRSAPQKRVEKKSDVVVRVYNTAPVERVWAHRFGPMASEFIEWRTNQPLGYLKMRCREMGVRYDDIVGKICARDIAKVRGDLMAEIKVAHPYMSLPDLGRLFGGRDHTTVRTALVNRGVETGRRKLISGYADQIRSMWESGSSSVAIGEAIGYCRQRVQMYLRDQPWYCKGANRASIADRGEEVLALLSQGLSYREIGTHTGFSPETVRKFCRRRGAFSAWHQSSASDRADEIRELLDAGYSRRQIAVAVGFSRASISKLIKSMGWTR